jgi:hypothetical protein
MGDSLGASFTLVERGLDLEHEGVSLGPSRFITGSVRALHLGQAGSSHGM